MCELLDGGGSTVVLFVGEFGALGGRGGSTGSH